MTHYITKDFVVLTFTIKDVLAFETKNQLKTNTLCIRLLVPWEVFQCMIFEPMKISHSSALAFPLVHSLCFSLSIVTTV